MYSNKVSVPQQNQSHQFFNDTLKSWLDKLTSVGMISKKDETMNSIDNDNDNDGSRALNFSNSNRFAYLQHVSESDDEDEDEDILENRKTSAQEPSNIQVSRFCNEDDLFANELKFLIVIFLNDSETLIDEVDIIWRDVKCFKVSPVIASAFTIYVIQKISCMFSTISINNPEIVTFQDFWDAALVVTTHFTDVEYTDLAKELCATASALSSFTTAYNCNIPRKALHLRRGYFGEPYDENVHPLKCVDVLGAKNKMADAMRFLMQEIPYMYNYYVKFKKHNIMLFRTIPMMKFLTTDFFELFESKKISLNLVVVCVVWIRIILVLQGNSFIQRVNFMMRDTLRSTKTRNMAELSHGLIAQYDNELHQLIKHLNVELESFINGDAFFAFTFYNPLFAGAFALDAMATNLHIGEQVLQSTNSFYRASSHIYNAFRKRNVIEKIPLFELFIPLFEDAIFYPNVPDGEKTSSFFDTYKLSSHLTAAAVTALKKENKKIRGKESKKRKRFAILSRRSTILRLLLARDIDIAPGMDDIKSMDECSALRLRERFQSTAEHELFGNKILNFDILSLHNIFFSLFNRLKDTLGNQNNYDFIYNNEFLNQSDNFRHTQALELCSSDILISVMDKWNDGSNNYGPTIAGAVSIYKEAFSSLRLDVFCFVSINSYTEEYYVALFGHKLFSPGVLRDSDMELFCEVMDILEDTAQTLTIEELNTVKAIVKENPQVLEALSLLDCTITAGLDCTGGVTNIQNIFDHFVCNPLHADTRMAEWLQLMGGGNNFYITPSIHVAIKCQNEFVTRYLLRACENFCHSIAVDKKTKNTPLHIACMIGNKACIDYLHRYNAPFTSRNRRGMLPIDVAVNESIKAHISAISETQANQLERCRRSDKTMVNTVTSSLHRSQAASAVREENMKAKLQDRKPQRSVSQAAVALSEHAAAELLAILDAEELLINNKNSSSQRSTTAPSNKKGKGGKKKK